MSEDLIFSPVLTRIDWSRYIEKTEEEAEMKSRDEETRDTEMREVAANPPHSANHPSLLLGVTETSLGGAINSV